MYQAGYLEPQPIHEELQTKSRHCSLDLQKSTA